MTLIGLSSTNRSKIAPSIKLALAKVVRGARYAGAVDNYLTKGICATFATLTGLGGHCPPYKCKRLYVAKNPFSPNSTQYNLKSKRRTSLCELCVSVVSKIILLHRLEAYATRGVNY